MFGKSVIVEKRAEWLRRLNIEDESKRVVICRDVHESETYRTVRCPVRTCSNRFEQSNSSNSSDSSNKLFTFASIDVPRLSPAHP